MKVEKAWLSAREAQAYLDCSAETLMKLRDAGRLRFSRFGGMIWYKKENLDKAMEALAV